MLFLKELIEKENQTMSLDITVNQKFFDPHDRFQLAEDGYTKVNKSVTRFVKGKLYGSRVSVTNTGDSHQNSLQIITEIPQGAIPMRSLDYLETRNETLDNLQTKEFMYYFYFPKSGKFTSYAASVTKDGFLLASSQKGLFEIFVHDSLEATNLNSINEIMSLGSKQDIVKFMKEQNILNRNLFQFESIYWLLKDKEFYESVIATLKERAIFDKTVWSFCIYHSDLETLKELLKYYAEYLGEEEGFFYMNSEFLKHDYYNFEEFSPLVNPRVHDIGHYKQNLLNKEFKQVYYNFLQYLISKEKLVSKDWLYLSIYMLMQDRIEETITIFPNIKKSDLQGRELEINYDYLTAYLDLYSDDTEFKTGRTICERYITYPVISWRNRFIDLANQIAEVDGEVGIDKIMTEEDQTAGEKDLKGTVEYLKAELKEGDGTIRLQTKNISKLLIYYHKIDIEVMFSENPFLLSQSNANQQNTELASIKAHKTETLLISGDSKSEYEISSIEIPQELANSNIVIQVKGENQSQVLRYFPSQMKIYILESIGEIKVKHENKPLSKVYVKCFARKSQTSNAQFYKDGYTDLRGTFDYASLLLEKNSDFFEFALMVYSEEFGGLIQVVKPPKKQTRHTTEEDGVALNLFGDSWAVKQKEEKAFWGKNKVEYKSK